MKGFRTINTQEKRVARTIEAKAYTKLGEFDYARSILQDLDCPDDFFVCLALLENDLSEVEDLFYKEEVLKSKTKFNELQRGLTRSISEFPNHSFNSFMQKIRQIESLLNSKND